MKYLFGTDLSADRNNKTPDGLQYRKVTLPTELEMSVQSRRDKAEKLEPFTYFPKWLKALKWALWSFGLLYGSRLLWGSVAPQRLPQTKWITGVGLAGGLLLSLTEGLRHLDGAVRPSVRQARLDRTSADREAKSWLGVPANAKKLDALAFDYVVENGTMFFAGPCRCLGLRAYRRADMLCLSDGEAVWSLPLTHVTGLRSIPCQTALEGWNKGDSPTLEKYQKAGLRVAKDKTKTLDRCCVLVWTDEGESWQLLFPAWERAKIEAMIRGQRQKNDARLRERQGEDLQ